MRAGRQRRRRGLLPAALALAWLAPGLPVLPPATAQDDDRTSVATTLYVRQDSDQTTVVTPRVRLGAPLAETTRADVIYTVDVWSSASIDIRTAASPRVIEQRDEIDAALTHGIGDVALQGSYRYSTEPDYESHGGSIGLSLELAQKSSTLAVDLGGMLDDVGRAGDPGFSEPLTTLSVRASFTQIIDQDTLAQLTYEVGRQQGYLSSPYRRVPIGPEEDAFSGFCAFPITACIPEANPTERTRHAVALRARRALATQLSLGASYRFYLDDWDMQSHTVRADVAFLPDDAWLLGLRYRYYSQTQAAHYRSFYRDQPEPQTHYTNDKELSPINAHRVGLEVGRIWVLDDDGGELDTVLSIAPALYQYPNYLPFDRVTAIETTLSLEARL